MASLEGSGWINYGSTRDIIYSNSVNVINTTGSHTGVYCMLSARAFAVGKYTEGKYQVGQVVLQLQKSGWSSGTSSMSIGSTSGSPSGFNYPCGSPGTTFSLSKIGYSWTNVVQGTAFSDITYKGGSKTVTLSTTIGASVAVSGKGNDTWSIPISVRITFNASNASIFLKYYKEDGSQYGSTVTGAYGTSVQIKSGYTKSPSTETDSGSYIVSFNSNGGTHVDSREYAWSWRRQLTYEFKSWGGYSPGSSVSLVKDLNLTASFSTSYGDRSWTRRSLGSLPTVNKKGYLKTNEWYYSNGSMASSSDEVQNSFTLTCRWEPQSYRIAFNLNGGQIPEDMGKISDYTTDKTYGVNSARTPNFTPLRLGYKFIGWSDQPKSITPIGVNAYIPDTFYNAVNTEYTNNNVTLYAQWEYNVNTVKCIYYLTDNGSEQVDIHTYNIDTATLDPQGDKAFLKYSPNQLRGGDFVFLGWLDTMPDGWDDSSFVNKGYHGTYTVPPESIVDSQGHEIEIELPIDIKIKNYKDLNKWGLIETYYGIWAKTGKYMKINGSWKKVNKCFVKINGVWKTVIEMWTKQNGSWKHEI